MLEHLTLGNMSVKAAMHLGSRGQLAYYMSHQVSSSIGSNCAVNIPENLHLTLTYMQLLYATVLCAVFGIDVSRLKFNEFLLNGD